MTFPVVMYKCESWTIRKAEHRRINVFELWCWRRLLSVPWTAKRSNQSIIKEIHPDIHWKDWCWSWNSSILATWCKELNHWKNPDAGKDWRWKKKGMTEDEMVGWHHQLYEREFEQAPGVGDGHGGCYSPWGCKESDTTERLNWTESQDPPVRLLWVFGESQPGSGWGLLPFWGAPSIGLRWVVDTQRPSGPPPLFLPLDMWALPPHITPHPHTHPECSPWVVGFLPGFPPLEQPRAQISALHLRGHVK